MEEASIVHAVERIEAALARIETHAAITSRKSADLQGRHEQLKACVARSLEELDGLIAGPPA
ncbi:hypothetical protein SAMN05518801_10587 [Novosphingobium sp. CF614]|nr:hypothetical protein SAMN05518801_10587 [Novosphingobium sp. CF614]